MLLAKQLASQHDEGQGGRIILMTSGQHLGPTPGELAYAISKGALLQAVLSLSDELIEQGITVNAVNPGPTDTGWGSSPALVATATTTPRSTPTTPPVSWRGCARTTQGGSPVR